MMKLTKKSIALLMALTLAVGCVVGGTFAILSAKTESVVNTFSAANMIEKPEDFTLQEHKAERNADGTYRLTQERVLSNQYEVLPGVNIAKNPFIILKNNESAYMYVEVVNKMPAGMSYEIDEKWEQLKSGDDEVKGAHGGLIYVYKEVLPKALGLGGQYNILKDQQVIVADDFVAPEPSETDTANENTLTFYAYVAQATGQENALAAWKAANFTV